MAKIDPGGHCTGPGEKAGQTTLEQTVGKQLSEECLGSKREIIHSYFSVSLRGTFNQKASPGTKIWMAPFTFPDHQHKYRVTCKNHSSTNTGLLTCLHQAPFPYTLTGLTFSAKIASVPAQWATHPENKHKTLSAICLLTREFCRDSVLVEVVSSLISQADQSILS